MCVLAINTLAMKLESTPQQWSDDKVLAEKSLTLA